MGPLELGARGRGGEPHGAAQAAVSTPPQRRVCVIPAAASARTAVAGALG